jgi:hypothetical protein
VFLGEYLWIQKSGTPNHGWLDYIDGLTLVELVCMHAGHGMATRSGRMECSEWNDLLETNLRIVSTYRFLRDVEGGCHGCDVHWGCLNGM